jgi:hypothetical protein
VSLAEAQYFFQKFLARPLEHYTLVAKLEGSAPGPSGVTLHALRDVGADLSNIKSEGQTWHLLKL